MDGRSRSQVCVSSRIDRDLAVKGKHLGQGPGMHPKSFGNFWILIPPQSLRLQPHFLFRTIRKAVGTQPADKATPNPIIFLFRKSSW
jgi:hypothetical protein